MTQSSASDSTPPSKGMLWGGRVLSALPSLALIGSAAGKISGAQGVVDNFAKFGFDKSAIAPIGIIELLSVVIYLIPKTRVLGAILLAGYLGGAIATHVRAGEAVMGIAPFMMAVFVWGGLYFRDSRIRALLPLA